MKTYKVTYSGNASRFIIFSSEVNATSERQAVENVFQQVLDENYFPQEDGTIKDCDGNEIATATDTTIDYDGGCFSADEVKDEIEQNKVDIIELIDDTYEFELHGKLHSGYTLDEVKEYLSKNNCVLGNIE